MKIAEDELIKIVGKAGMSLGGGEIVQVGNINPDIQLILDKYGLSSSSVGKALNDPTASKSGSNSPNPFLLLTAYYIAQGYSHRQIYSVLEKYHGYSWSFSKFFKDFKIIFGSIHDAREVFTKPLINQLADEGLSRRQIDEFFPLLKEDFDMEAFLDLVRRGYELKDLAHLFGLSIVMMKIKINELIDEQFPDLQIYNERENIRGRLIEKSRPTWEDLRYFLLSQEIQGLAADALTIWEAASSFYSPSKPDGLEAHFITKICKKVLKNSYSGVKDSYIHGILREIIIQTGNPEYQDFINNAKLSLHSKDSRGRMIARKLATKYIHAEGRYSYLLRKIKTNLELSVAEREIVLKCAVYGIITPLLKNSYKAHLTPNLIADKYGFFASESEVIFWTKEIFKMEPSELIRFLISNDLNVDLVNKYGARS